MRSFLIPRLAAVGDPVQQTMPHQTNTTICHKILLDLDTIEYFKQNYLVLWRFLFIWACERLSIHKALHIDVWEMAISHCSGWRWWANAKWCQHGARIHIQKYPLHWHHIGQDSVSNHQPHNCLLNRLFRRRSKKTSQLRVTGLCVGNSPGTGEFPAQMPVMRKMFPFDDVIMTT